MDVEVISTQDGLEARIQERKGGSLIQFPVDAFEWTGDVVTFRTNAARKWMFRALL